MALYKLDDTGEAIRVDYGDFKEWCESADMTTLILARHDIIEHRQLKALAVDVLKGRYHHGKVLATVETKMKTSCDENVGPWHTGVEGEEPEYKSRSRAQALEAHKSLVNRVTKRYNGRVLI